VTGGLDHLRLGLRNVRAHKLRSGLTVLGVVFGVAAVVSMLSIAGGAQRVAVEQIRLLGTNAVRVSHLELRDEARELAERQGSRGLRAPDGEMLRTSVPGLIGVAPIRFVEAPVLRRGRESKAHVVATNADYPQITGVRAEQGRFLGELDVRGAKRVAVLGASVKRDLFGFQDPIGHYVQIGDVWFTVVGWTEPRAVREGQPGLIQVRDVNRDVYVPVSTAQQRLPDSDREDGIAELALRLAHEDLVVPAAEIVERLLLRSHRGAWDFEVRVPAELLAQAQSTQRVFNVVMGSIAAISLLVGGIGIMNVMLTTVTERTREIGIRRAVGATRNTILRQFLIETVVISGLGGILGIGLGLAMGRVIHWYAGWEIAVSLPVLLLAFGISALVGVVFGLVPARRAAWMDPIAALRFE
jgi:putative ABC transport system permease protein